MTFKYRYDRVIDNVCFVRFYSSETDARIVRTTHRCGKRTEINTLLSVARRAYWFGKVARRAFRPETDSRTTKITNNRRVGGGRKEGRGRRFRRGRRRVRTRRHAPDGVRYTSGRARAYLPARCEYCCWRPRVWERRTNVAHPSEQLEQ